jgi:uncharacterized membrane protein YkvA (DUF1232 family)/lambda repressor-like predicted transcriptional regulator
MPSEGRVEDFPAFLARRLRERGLSLRALGRASGVAHTTLSRLLRGRLRPTPAVLLAIAPHVGEPLAALLARAGLATEADPGAATPNPTPDPEPRLGGLAGLLPVPGLNLADLRQDLDRLSAQALDPRRAAEIREAFAVKLDRAGPSGPVAERLQALYRRYADPSQPEPVRRLCGGALLYFLQPADRIDDALLSLGYLDDAVVAEMAWRAVQRLAEGGRPGGAGGPGR